jgi:hypothetical protein
MKQETVKFDTLAMAAIVADCFKQLSQADQERSNANELFAAASQEMQVQVDAWRKAGITKLGNVGADEKATALRDALRGIKDDDGSQYYADTSIANMICNFRAALKTGRYSSNPSQAKSRAKAKKRSDTAKAQDMCARLIKFIEDHEEFKFDAPRALASLKDVHRNMCKVVASD